MATSTRATRRHVTGRFVRCPSGLEPLERRHLLALDCIDFEDLTLATNYAVGDTFVADDAGFRASIAGAPFTWSSGGTTSGGHARVDNKTMAGDVGQDLNLNNILLSFRFLTGPAVSGIRLNFGEYGGNLNLEVNGDFRNFANFKDIDGTIIGGTLVSVPLGGTGQDKGVLQISGEVNTFKIGGQELWIDRICTSEIVPARFDWGDAPDKPYRTLAASNGAIHRIEPKVYLGKRVDAESNGQPTAMSDGDDVNPGIVSDDEDGVFFVTPLIPGQSAEVEVVASTKGWLNAWIDFDGNGVWSAGPENIFVAESLVPGSNVLKFTVPKSAVDIGKPAYSRWRFSTTDRQLDPFGGSLPSSAHAIPDGEVEDHVLFIREAQPSIQYDYGDAPDGPYPTLWVHGGARHVIQRGFLLGELIDSDVDGIPNVDALGDDKLDSDDEDGVEFLTPLVPGREAQVRVVASDSGRLDGWIDFDRDGRWEPAPEQIAVSLPLIKGANIIRFPVPPWAVAGDTYARFRLSREGGLTPIGEAASGEVEDYKVRIEAQPTQGPPTPTVEIGESSVKVLSGRIKFPTPTLIPLEGGGKEWVQMLSPGSESIVGPIGLPAVPVYRRLIAVPAGAQVSVQLRGQPRVASTLHVPLVPFQETAPDADQQSSAEFDDPPGFRIDRDAYASQGSFPDDKQLVRIVPLGKLRDLEVALLEVTTAQYSPLEQQLTVLAEVEWQVEFSGGKGGFLPEQSLSPFENSHGLYEAVLNADVIDEYIYPGEIAIGQGEELLILTHPDFREAADKLAEWKEHKGIMTSVLEVGTGTPTDTREEIKDLIETRWNRNLVRPSYLLLMGDAEFIPTYYRRAYYAGGAGSNELFNEDANQGAWSPLGTVHFNGTGSEYVQVQRLERDDFITDPGSTVADAVRFVNDDTLAEVIVDNLDAGFSITAGDWYESGAVDEYSGSSLFAFQEGATARFTPVLAGEGLYRVYARWSGLKGDGTRYDRDSQSSFTIFSANTGTDTPYTLVAGGVLNILPDLANGRIPVDTAQQAMDVVDKIIEYEQSPPGPGADVAFYSNVSLASQFQGYRDDDPEGRDKRAFIEESERTRNTLLSAGKTVERIYTKTEDLDQLDQHPNRYYDGSLLPADLRVGSGFGWDGWTGDITAAFNAGRFLVIHRDHGSPSGWAHPDYEVANVTGSLTNGDLTPVVYSINCASGLFDNETAGPSHDTVPGGVYFVEQLLRENDGGAVAVIGDTRNSNTWTNNAFLRGLIDATWPDHDADYGEDTSLRRIGDIMNYAKTYTITQIGAASSTPEVEMEHALDTLNLYHVYGDPTLEMRIADPYRMILPERVWPIEIHPDRLRLKYEVDGAIITAYQVDEGGVIPLGRELVDNGTVTMELIAEADLQRPIFYAACLPDSICQALSQVGDLNADGLVDAIDIDQLCHALSTGSQEQRFDLDGNNRVDRNDKAYLVENILGTNSGDANLDGLFNSNDMIDVFRAGEYEDAMEDNSGWADGDWNCDFDFNSYDMVLAFQTGNYEIAKASQPQAVSGQSNLTARMAAAVDRLLADETAVCMRRRPDTAARSGPHAEQTPTDAGAVRTAWDMLRQHDPDRLDQLARQLRDRLLMRSAREIALDSLSDETVPEDNVPDAAFRCFAFDFAGRLRATVWATKGDGGLFRAEVVS